MSNQVEDNYSLDVVKAGDEASGNFKKKCDAANEQTSIRNLLKTDGRVWSVNTGLNGIENVIESIDGVGTKVQIYTTRFNWLVGEQEKGHITDQALLTQSIELWERMLHDLIAMNVDDLRNGEMAVCVTNIIDINSLKGVRGKVFSDSMGQALYNVISYLDIAMTAGETAVLGLTRKESSFVKLIGEIWMDLTNILELEMSDKVKSKINGILEKAYSRKQIIIEDLDLNIGGTGLGIMGRKEKLVDLKVGQAIVYLRERPTKNGIIGPRSNGLTDIRKYLTQLAGEGWENLSFIDFLDVIGDEMTSKIPFNLYTECKGLNMWDIATGKTTIFNPFVSRVLLGGLKSNPIIGASSLIHVTGNPGRKIVEGLKGRKDLAVDLDISKIKLPQIVEILLLLGCYSEDESMSPDEKAMKSLNMGVPYAIVCNQEDVETIIKEAEADESGIIAEQIGNVVERKEEKIAGTIKGVGLNDTEIIIMDEAA